MAKTFTFRAPAAEILGVISRVSRVDKSAVQVLGGVHMTLKDKELVVQATDMSLILRERLPVTYAGEGSRVVLDAGKVLKGLSTLDGIVTFAGKQDVLSIQNGSTTLKYAFGKLEDYPKLPEGMGGGSAVICPRKEFELTFGTVKAAIGKDQSRPVLCGVHLSMDEGRVRMAATDSFRLASDSCSSSGGDFGEAIVNGADFRKALAFVSQGIPPSKNGEIALSRFDKWVVLSAGERSAWLREVEGQFPNYRQLIPESFEGCVELDRRAALKVFDRMDKLNEGNRPARIEVVGVPKGVGLDEAEMQDEILTSLGHPDLRDTNLVESKIGAKIAGVYENGFPFGINPGFMYDALDAIGADTARFHYINPLRPCLITEQDWNHQRGGMPDRFYLIMPIRLPS